MNLNGYAGTARSADIFALRPADVAISYMGFPGTLGSAELVDYILADRVVIPRELRRYYDEKVLCGGGTGFVSESILVGHGGSIGAYVWRVSFSLVKFPRVSEASWIRWMAWMVSCTRGPRRFEECSCCARSLAGHTVWRLHVRPLGCLWISCHFVAITFGCLRP